MNYADNTYPFRQDSTFLYFFGLSYAGLSAIIDIDNDKEIIFGDELTIDDIVWMGTQPTLKEKSERVGVLCTQSSKSIESYLKNAQSKGQQIHFLPTYRPEHKLKLMDWLGYMPAAQEASVPFIRAVVNQRNYKSVEEIVEIEKACNTTADMHIKAMQILRPGMKESQIAGALADVALSAGGNLSFPTIATINGQTLHNHYHGNIVKSGDMLLLDAGRRNCDGYMPEICHLRFLWIRNF